MTGAAPRVAQQKVVGEAQVLQVVEMQGRRADAMTAVAGWRIGEGSIRTGCTIKVLRGGDLVSTVIPAVPLNPGRESDLSLGPSDRLRPGEYNGSSCASDILAETQAQALASS